MRMKLFFACVCIFATNAVEQHILFNVLSQPRLFASTLANLAPGAAQKTADDIQTLINTGEDERADEIAKLAAAQEELDKASEALTKATEHLEGQEQIMTDLMEEHSKLESQKESQSKALTEASTNTQVKSAALDHANERNKTEGTRIDHERAIFEEVIAKVAPLASNNLIEADPTVLIDIFSNADPEAIHTLVEALQKMIDNGEKARKAAISDLATAQTNSDVAKEAEKKAEKDLSETLDKIDQNADAQVPAAQNIDAAKVVQKEADKHHKKKLGVFNKVKALHDEEIARIDGEYKTLKDAMAQLIKLNQVVGFLA